MKITTVRASVRYSNGSKGGPFTTIELSAFGGVMNCKCGRPMTWQRNTGCYTFYECWQCERKVSVHDDGTIRWWELVEIQEGAKP